MILRILLYALLIYVLYKIIFELIVPVYKTTQHLKKGFHEMQSRMNQQMQNQQQENTFTTKPQTPSQKTDGDYIEFEEIK